MTLTVRQFPCLSDNYGFLIRDEASGKTACIDTPDAGAILKELKAAGWGLDFIFNTHWHADHAGGNAEIKAATGIKGKELYHPVRIALTGSHSGPDFDKLIPLIEDEAARALGVVGIRQRIEEFVGV